MRKSEAKVYIPLGCGVFFVYRQATLFLPRRATRRWRRGQKACVEGKKVNCKKAKRKQAEATKDTRACTWTDFLNKTQPIL